MTVLELLPLLGPSEQAYLDPEGPRSMRALVVEGKVSLAPKARVLILLGLALSDEVLADSARKALQALGSSVLTESITDLPDAVLLALVESLTEEQRTLWLNDLFDSQAAAAVAHVWPLPDSVAAFVQPIRVADDGQEEVVPDPTPLETLPKLLKLGLAERGNAYACRVLAQNKDSRIATAVLKNTGLDDKTTALIGRNSATHVAVLNALADSKEWTKFYRVKLALLQNPKTPLVVSMRFLGVMQSHDLKQLSNTRTLPSALLVRAKQMLEQKAHRK